MHATLSSLHVYPLKSARGISVDRWPVDRWGPRYDRRWMITDPDGVFISQREEPRLALLETALTADALVLETSGADPLALPLEPGPTVTRPVRIWRDVVEAESCGADADRWLAAFLGRPVHLVRMPDRSVRQLDRTVAREGERTAFADDFPFLLAGTASLEDLNARLDRPLPMNRFRPNLVVDGTLPFEEDGWVRVAIGELEFRVVRPCPRCPITTTDQETGERGVEPLRTLATFRKRNGKVMFGQNLVHEGTGALRVGERIRVIERRPASPDSAPGMRSRGEESPPLS